MSNPCIVVIASPAHFPSLIQRVGTSSGEILTFSDAEPLRALETITERRPQVVALERLFALTPRGAALINRIKADPKLTQVEVRVVAHDSDYSRVVPRATAPPPALDQRGTRRAARSRMNDQTRATIDGETVTVVDLSTVGAQVASANGLKPNQVVVMALGDDVGTVQINAIVVWTAFG